MTSDDDDDDLRAVEQLLEQLARPIMTWRMAKGLTGRRVAPYLYSNGAVAGAERRRVNALRLAREMIDAYATRRFTP